MDPITDLSMLSLSSKQNELTETNHQTTSKDLSEIDSEQTLNALESRSAAAEQVHKTLSISLSVMGILKAVFSRPLRQLFVSSLKSASSLIFSKEERSWELTANRMAPSLLKGSIKTNLFSDRTSNDVWKSSIERELTERIISVANRDEIGTENFTSAFKFIYSKASDEQELKALRAIARSLHLEHLI